MPHALLATEQMDGNNLEEKIQFDEKENNFLQVLINMLVHVLFCKFV